MQQPHRSPATQQDIDESNRRFWNELCGTQLAQTLGLAPGDDTAVDKFDRAYLSMYPYLLDRVPVHTFTGKKVLEVGLGFGTLGQQLALHSSGYRGLDIAHGPVEMMNTRLARLGLSGQDFSAVQGSMLNCPFPDSEFDVVVSIGCFHHTGDLHRCIEETRRVLKPGGYAYIMVYNKFSYRNWIKWPLTTIRAALSGSTTGRSHNERLAYDANAQGEAAPETVFTSVEELRDMFSRYSSFSAVKRNCGAPLGRFTGTAHRVALAIVGPLAGLDVYVSARK